MAELALSGLSALGGASAAVFRGDGIVITENDGVAMASLALRAGREAEAAAALARATGLELPGPGGMARAGDWAAFWTAPGQWMLTAPFASHEEIAAEVTAAVAGAASVTEQTDGWVRLEIEGARVVAMFERLCNVDLATLAADRATRCQIEHLGALLLCHRQGAAVSLLTLRSGAASMLHALETAARSL